MPFPKRERTIRAVAGKFAAWRPSGQRRQADEGSGGIGFPGHPIGSFDHCWCGAERNHDWAGKNSGVPHPQPPSETENPS
ncbi:hypothetical protein [Streptomyces sp. NPDC002671]